MTALLDVTGLSVAYTRAPVLHEVSLEVRPGEVVALLGANGAGKTTLLKAIIGLLRPRSGRVVLENRSFGGEPAHARVRRGLGYCPEGRRIFPGLSVLENLTVASRVDGATTQARLDEIFVLFPDLATRRSTPGWQLSGGQQQMLAIGRALMTNPKLLLLDEPSLGLAPVLVDQVLEKIGAIAKSGAAVLIAEQNAARALAIADRAYVLQLGRIVLSGLARDLAGSERLKAAFLGGEPVS